MDIEVYRHGNRYYFIENETQHEGEIYLGTGEHGGEYYKYVSHIDMFDTVIDDELTELYENWLEDHIDEILDC